ncbi:hypothetical protein FOZ63_023794 [Perkinsus olseni]|uniref:Uncharacterized protein n=1 Tax=Perkinsus olseni TaxID=32597 RepID=A0A7J6RHX6_PEROL|nr:hypothetical protein FOZ63_023794 [Perkinsus olseni]
MSPKQFIISGVSAAAAAAAALLSNSPLVTAIGSVAQHNTPTDDYPPPDENANFDAKNDAAYCSFNNKRIDEISQSKLLHIDVNSSRIHMRRIHCPKGEKHLPLQLGFFDENALTWYSRGHDVFPDRRIFTFDALPGSFPPENTGLDPLRDLDASTLADAITNLSSAVRALGRTKLALRYSAISSKIDNLYSAVRLAGFNTTFEEYDPQAPQTEARRLAIDKL